MSSHSQLLLNLCSLNLHQLLCFLNIFLQTWGTWLTQVMARGRCFTSSEWLSSLPSSFPCCLELQVRKAAQSDHRPMVNEGLQALLPHAVSSCKAEAAHLQMGCLHPAAVKVTSDRLDVAPILSDRTTCKAEQLPVHPCLSQTWPASAASWHFCIVGSQINTLTEATDAGRPMLAPLPAAVLGTAKRSAGGGRQDPAADST